MDIIDFITNCDNPYLLMQTKNAIDTRLQDGFVVGDIAYLALTQGQLAVIDAEDLPRVKNHKWYYAYNEADDRGYARAKIDGKSIVLHRFLLDVWDSRIVDHILGNTMDCRKKQLRIVNKYQSMANRGGWSRKKDNGLPKSQFSGVCWGHNAWRCVITRTVDNRKITCSLGRFGNEQTAALAYDYAARLVHGQYARLNFPHIEYLGVPLWMTDFVSARLKFMTSDSSWTTHDAQCSATPVSERHVQSV